MHELRRRFAIDGGDDDVTPVRLDAGHVYVGLPDARGPAPRRAAARRRDRLRAVARPADADRHRRLPDAPGAARLIAPTRRRGRTCSRPADVRCGDGRTQRRGVPRARALRVAAGCSPASTTRRSTRSRRPCAAAASGAARSSSTPVTRATRCSSSLAGQVKIIVPSDDGAEPAILTTIGPGGFFGELALLDGAPRSATAVALDAVETHGPAARRVRRACSTTEPGLRRALLVVARRRDPPAHGPGGGPPFPRPAGPARAPPAARGRDADGRPPDDPATCAASVGCRGRTPRPSWPA